MKEIAEKKWGELEQIWKQLYDRNMTATPFQSYEYLTFTRKGKPYRKDLFRLIGVKEWNLVLYNDGQAIAIAPLLIKKKQGKYKVYMRGHFTVANQLDLIYESLSYDDFLLIMRYIEEKLGNVALFFDRVSEKTVTCSYMKAYFASKKIEEHECFSIPIPEEHEIWLKSLSKSARQNTNNHFNRLKRDDVEWNIRFFCGEKVGKDLAEKMMRVYGDRFMEKNDCLHGPLKGIVSRLLLLYLQKDRMTRWMNISDDNFHAVLYINSEIAAFCSGLICKDKRIILSRLSMYTKYSKYSPGGILIFSVIKYIVEQNAKGLMDIEQLDLSQGGCRDGMSYKNFYGGQVHYSYLFYE